MKRIGLVLGLVLTVAVLAAAVSAQRVPEQSAKQLRALKDAHGTQNFWSKAAKPGPIRGVKVAVHARKFRPLTLDSADLRAALDDAPREFTPAASSDPLVISLPTPGSSFQRFALQESAIMAPGLAERHPGIKTYSGRGITDLSATIHADLTPLGFRASVRSPHGNWYIDPYHVGRTPSVYASYYVRQVENTGHANNDTVVESAGLPVNVPDIPPTGDQIRTYRLALISDPGYATYHGGPQNVTPAKVALINRVNHIYEDDLTIRLQLIANNDLLNLDTYAEAVAPNGPCGAAGCYTQSQVLGCQTGRQRVVISQIIGASNYDVGHLGLGQPGGGVANLGVVGRGNKAGGCTGLPTPVGDFFAVDYVAHELGHQFAGNHTFDGNQLNCSGGNRSAANSVEPGSGQSVMAYAGICLTDDLQPHSDPYFSQRSQQEITTYVATPPGTPGPPSTMPINEVQTVSLSHFGGGDEVQVATLGPGYSRPSSITPLSVSINTVPSATSRGGAMQSGNTVTIATATAHQLQVGDQVSVAGVVEPQYNGTFTVTAVPATRAFQYEHTVTGLPVSGGAATGTATATHVVPGATSSGTTATIKTNLPHGRTVGDVIVVSGVAVADYNGTFTITAVPSARTFQYTLATSDLAASGGGTATYLHPFRVRIGGRSSELINSTPALAYGNTVLTNAINAIPGFAGTVAVTSATSTGFTVTFSGASAGADVSNIQLAELNCGCFSSVEETNHGGAFDSFRLNYDGNVSGPITNGTNYTADDIDAALTALLPAGGNVTVGGLWRWNRTLQQHRVPGHVHRIRRCDEPASAGRAGLHSGRVRLHRRDRQGRPRRQRRHGHADREHVPDGQRAGRLHDPAADAVRAHRDGDGRRGRHIVYSWEQNDQGNSATNTAGQSLLYNVKTDGPLFAMFPKSAPVSEEDTLLYNSPSENHLTTSPTRVFPDLQQILINNTNADTGACPFGGRSRRRCRFAIRECFAEFLPTSDYSARRRCRHAALPLHGTRPNAAGGGNNSADMTLTLAQQRRSVPRDLAEHRSHLPGGLGADGHWDKANTDIPPTSTSNVKISLSTDGGLTYPHVLAASTANDGSEAVTIPRATTDRSREDRGRRQRLLRRLEHELHDRHSRRLHRHHPHHRLATSAATTSASASASTTATSAAPPPPARCRVPNVIGLRLATAKARIRARRCRVGTVRRVRSRRVGRVVGQSPRGGSVRRVGFKVNLRVGRR